MPGLHSNWILPGWPAPSCVHAFVTTRHGGVSSGAYASLNLGDAVGDATENVAENRRRLESCLPSPPIWLRQVHGNTVVCAEDVEQPLEADATTARRENVVCTVMAADCLPVLLCDRAGTVVAAVHAGWRGLAAGVIENAVRAMRRPGHELMAFLGPAIGPAAFEVGQDVRAAFIKRDARAQGAFRAHQEGKWLADLFFLARQRLLDVEVSAVYGGSDCTYTDPGRFFSHRRDHVSGRMAALIWLARPGPTA
jgi:purine-nucleoside/S-methyl-5'-thioadenosine phosphorylase / adenosine deaminase